MESLAKQAEEAAGQKNLKELYSITRKKAGEKTVSDHLVIDKNGITLTNPEDQRSRWKEHFEELLNRPTSSEPTRPDFSFIITASQHRQAIEEESHYTTEEGESTRTRWHSTRSSESRLQDFSECAL